MARWVRLRHSLGRGFPVCVSIVACPYSVSTSRSSNRTGGFTASGSRIRVMVSPTSNAAETDPGSVARTRVPDDCQGIGLCPAHRVRVSAAATDGRDDTRASAPREKGRVERWRGGVGFGIFCVGVSPVCVSIAACRAPFPPPAHRTGRADFPHPALGQGSWFRPRVTTGKFPEVQQSKLALQIAVGILAVSLPIELQTSSAATDGPGDRRAECTILNAGV